MQIRSDTTYNLLCKIELMRKRLNNIAEHYGIQHPLTLAYSRKLDKLIAKAQRGMWDNGMVHLQRLNCMKWYKERDLKRDLEMCELWLNKTLCH